MRRRFGGTSSPQMEPGSAGRCICDGAAQLAAQRADRSRVVPPKGSKSRSNQPPAAGGPSQTAPEKTRLQRAGRGKCLATPPGAVPGLHDTENGSR